MPAVGAGPRPGWLARALSMHTRWSCRPWLHQSSQGWRTSVIASRRARGSCSVGGVAELWVKEQA